MLEILQKMLYTSIKSILLLFAVLSPYSFKHARRLFMSAVKIKSFSREGYLNENYHYFHLQDTAGQEKNFHFHEFDKIVLLLSGRVDYIVEDITYSLEPWSVLLVRHHAIHKALIDVSIPYNRIILYLDRSFFSRRFPDTPLMACFESSELSEKCLLFPNYTQKEALSSIIRAYEASIKDLQFGSDTMRDTFIIQFLILVNRISASGETNLPTDRRYDEKIRQTLSYINENLSLDLTVDFLSSRVFLSKYHFMRLFKQQTGTTVHSYVRQRRLLYAARLIREGIPAGQASSLSGFNDYSVFNRAFRECFGVRPIDLKK